MDTVQKTVRTDPPSDFLAFLLSIFDADTVASTAKEYRLGVTKSRDVIFYQIDIHGRCRTGKVMKYDSKTGHRIKDEAVGGRITWVHSLMKRNGALKADWELTQCLFGEHLLSKCPGRTVALVESEKTAVICSALMPEYVWLATGGKSQLGDKLNVLQQRTIIAFPDVDGYELWKQKASELTSLRITVSDYLETTATPSPSSSHYGTPWKIRTFFRLLPTFHLNTIPLGGTRDIGTQNREKVMNTQIQQIVKMFLNYPQLMQSWSATEFVFLSDDSVGFRVTTPIYNGTIPAMPDSALFLSCEMVILSALLGLS